MHRHPRQRRHAVDRRQTVGKAPSGTSRRGLFLACLTLGAAPPCVAVMCRSLRSVNPGILPSVSTKTSSKPRHFGRNTVKILRNLAFCFVFFWCSVAAAAGITKKEIHDMLASIDRAILAENISEFSNYINEKAIFEIDYKSDNGAETMTFGKEDYISFVQQGIIRTDHYEIDRNIKNINIISPNVALVTSRLVEKVSVGNQRLTASSRERFTIERIDGTLQITAYFSKTRL